MKLPRILLGTLLVCAAAACSSPTASDWPSVPIPDADPNNSETLSIPIP